MIKQIRRPKKAIKKPFKSPIEALQFIKQEFTTQLLITIFVIVLFLTKKSMYTLLIIKLNSLVILSLQQIEFIWACIHKKL